MTTVAYSWPAIHTRVNSTSASDPTLSPPASKKQSEQWRLRQTANGKDCNWFFFSCNPWTNHTQKRIMPPPPYYLLQILFHSTAHSKQLKTDGKTLIFIVCRFTLIDCLQKSDVYKTWLRFSKFPIRICFGLVACWHLARAKSGLNVAVLAQVCRMFCVVYIPLFSLVTPLYNEHFCS